MPEADVRQADVLLKLLEMYNREPMERARRWVFHELKVKDYAEYKRRYGAFSPERDQLDRLANFYEVGGVLVNRGLLHEDLFFEVFPVRRTWEHTKAIVLGMRAEIDQHLYENFEQLYERFLDWDRRHPAG